MAIQSQEQRAMLTKLAAAMGLEVDSTVISEVVRTGDKIVLPEGASIPEVIDSLKKQHQSEQQVVAVKAEVACPPWDGSLALQEAIKQHTGLLIQESGWGGVAGEIDVEVELGKSISVRWGEFSLPGMGDEAMANTGVQYDQTSGRWMFACIIKCKRKHQERARKILDTMRAIAANTSLHRGKAFSLKFVDDNGRQIAIPTPKFFQISNEMPIFRRELEEAIERNVFVPLRHSDDLLAMGESLKRGVLFAGEYGTGKTMLASYIARVAVENGWTFMYVKESAELPHALREAIRLQPCVVFAEDVDRVAGLERTDEVNSLLNQLDGIESKNSRIMTVLTSNHADEINPAMRRPGRIDLILQVLPPDADTVIRMAHRFSHGGIEDGADLTLFGQTMAGSSPANVREAVGRARLESLRRTGSPKSQVNGDDLAAVAREVVAERAVFDKPKNNDRQAEREAMAEGFEVISRVMREVTAE